MRPDDSAKPGVVACSPPTRYLYICAAHSSRHASYLSIHVRCRYIVGAQNEQLSCRSDFASNLANLGNIYSNDFKHLAYPGISSGLLVS
jgi:hypothetical protein